MKFGKFSGYAVVGLCAWLAWLPAGAQDVEAGRTKAQVCAACHGTDGNSTVGTFPNLAGQTWRYIYVQLKDFKEGRRTDPVMSPQAASLSRQDMIDIANFYAVQAAKPSSFKTDDAKVRMGQGQGRGKPVLDVPSRRFFGSERDSARRGPAIRILCQTNERFQGTYPHQRCRQHDQRVAIVKRDRH
jgi:cytochrome c553